MTRTCRASACAHENKLDARYCARCGAGMTTRMSSIPRLSSWKSLKDGMTQHDVLQLLGKPIRQKHWGIDSKNTTWYYAEGNSNSTVSFSADGKLYCTDEPILPPFDLPLPKSWWKLRLRMTRDEIVALLGVPNRDQGETMSYLWKTCEGWVEFIDGQVCGIGLDSRTS